MSGVRIFLVLILVFGFGGLAFLSTWPIPAPEKTISKVIPNARFTN
ncbi:hypothetical protein HIMB100_00017990 [SAR116 cluster alpha proteobacterium HIMB100]|nr:hypothetical protein HIMB100_00017990 [SAR116 cluster alpha proteobacterium HIMB100]